jgi:hypothetical protein
LDMLFDFGELNAVHAPDPSARPLLLFGEGSGHLGRADLGATAGHGKDAWKRETAGANYYCVIEG